MTPLFWNVCYAVSALGLEILCYHLAATALLSGLLTLIRVASGEPSTYISLAQHEFSNAILNWIALSLLGLGFFRLYHALPVLRDAAATALISDHPRQVEDGAQPAPSSPIAVGRQRPPEDVSSDVVVSTPTASSSLSAASAMRSEPPRTPSREAQAFAEALGSPTSPVYIPYAPFDGSSKAYDRVMVKLGYRLEQVLDALQRKFSLRPTGTEADKLQPTTIVSMDYESRHSLALRTGVVEVKRQRIVIGLDDVPWLIRRSLSANTMQFVVDTEFHAVERLLFVLTRNANLHEIGKFQETASYSVHPEDPNSTQYVSRVELVGNSFLSRQVLSVVGSSGLTLIQSHLSLLRARLLELHGPEA